MAYGNPKPTMGIPKNQTSSPGSQPDRPGAITHGPGKNKPGKNHLVSSKGKIPAEVYAHAVASRQNKMGNPSRTGPTKLPNHTPLQGADPHVNEAQSGTASGTVLAGHPVHAEPKKDFLNKPVGTLYGNLGGAKKAGFQTIDTRGSLQKRKDAMARRA